MQTKQIIKSLGGPVAIANILGIKPQAVSQWQHIPTDHVLKLAETTAWEITPNQMRPDIYPNASDGIRIKEAA